MLYIQEIRQFPSDPAHRQHFAPQVGKERSNHNSPRKKRINDEHLSNGSIIFWSRRFAENGRYYVPVRCGDCGEERVINASGAHSDFTGLCPDCAHFRKRKVSLTTPQTLPNGSIIYWNEEHIEESARMVPVRCGGPFCGGSFRTVPVYTTYAENFTGCGRRINWMSAAG